MASGVVVSQEIAATRADVWDALLSPASPPGARAGAVILTRIGLGGTILDLDVVDPVDGLTGTALWAGEPHRVTIHLVDLGGAATLLVLTADEEVQGVAHPLLAGGRSALAHRQVVRDLRQVADDVLRRTVGAGARG